MRTWVLTLVAWSVVGCVRPADERALEDLEVGVARAEGLAIAIDGGTASIHRIVTGYVELWAQAPVVRGTLEVTGVSGPITFAAHNCMPDAILEVRDSAGGLLDTLRLDSERATLCIFEFEAAAGDYRITLGPGDAAFQEPFRFASMGDIQTALADVGDVFEVINQQDVRFVVSTGDLVEDGLLGEYELLLERLQLLEVPYFSTIGNHELWGETHMWTELFGRRNVHFRFKGVAFSLVDSGNASLDPLVYDWLDQWLNDAVADVHVFGTHYPPIDPVGARAGSFRSRKEAAKLLNRLAAGQVDITLYGHIHSYYAFENAGIPAYISGGGGAIPERLDNIGRHVLVHQADPGRGMGSVEVVRVDP